jgi:hypothetical protein
VAGSSKPPTPAPARPPAAPTARTVNPKADQLQRKPPADLINDFHTNSDVDSAPDAHHHRLGLGPNQAAPGMHTHDGSDSPLILDGLQITGAKGTAGWYSSVNALLVRLGAADQST